MPRNVRNFWIDCLIDGQATRLSGGPQAKDGGFDLTIKMRDNGGIIEAVDVLGRADASGKLTLTVRRQSDNAELSVIRER